MRVLTGISAVLGLAMFFAARLMGAHWNALLMFWMVAAPVGLAWRLVAWRRGQLDVASLLDPEHHAARAHTALRALTWCVGAMTVHTAIVRVQFTPEDLEGTYLMSWALAMTAVAGAAIPMRGRSTVVTAAISLIGLVLTWDLSHALADPAGPAVTLRSPFAEPATVFHGGQGTLINHHYAIPQQRDALDMVLAPGGTEHIGDPSTLEGWACWGKPLVAPADARVVSVVSDRPDMPIGETDLELIIGNHVILEIDRDHYVLMAHLQQGSLVVAPGDTVAAGQPIASCGNSGNTSQPHLHLQAQSAPDFSNGDRTLHTWPIRFEQVERGGEVQPAIPRRNDIVLPPG